MALTKQVAAISEPFTGGLRRPRPGRVPRPAGRRTRRAAGGAYVSNAAAKCITLYAKALHRAMHFAFLRPRNVIRASPR